MSQRLIDRAAFVVGSHCTLATGLYYAGRGAHAALSAIPGISSALGWTEDHLSDPVKLGATLAVGVATQVYAGRKLIWPYARRIADKPFSWGKTVAYASLAGLLGWHAGCGSDVRRISGSLRDGLQREDLLNVPNARMVAGWAAGMREARSLNALSRKLTGRSFDRHIDGGLDAILSAIDDFATRTNRSLAEQVRVESDIDRATHARNPAFPYSDDLSRVAQKYVGKGYFRNAEEFVYVARVLDREAGGEGLEGMRAVAWVMKDRVDSGIDYFSRGRQGNYFDVAFKSGMNSRGARVYQFSCVAQQGWERYWRDNEGEGKWDMYRDGALHVDVGKISRARAGLAVQALTDVLDNRVPDPTGKALFYQNRRAADRFNQDWDRKYRHTVDIGHHSFFRLRG